MSGLMILYTISLKAEDNYNARLYMEHVRIPRHSIFSMLMYRRVLYVGELEMTQYDDRVQMQKMLLDAEEWSKGVASLHAHSSNSMYYDDRPGDTEGKSVIDVEYNSGIIERWQDNKIIHTFGEKLKGEELVQKWRQHT